MSSLGGETRSGNFVFSASTVSMVSSTDSVVWESQTTFDSSRTSTFATSSGPSTMVMWSGASPEVPMTSSWPSWPMRRMSKSSFAYRIASLWTLVTSGQVASIVAKPAARRLLVHHRRHAVRGEHHDGARRDLLRPLDEDGALLLQRLDDVLVVHDLVADVDRRTVLLEGLLDSDHGTVHARAVAARGGEQDAAGCGSGGGSSHTLHRTGVSSRPDVPRSTHTWSNVRPGDPPEERWHPLRIPPRPRPPRCGGAWGSGIWSSTGCSSSPPWPRWGSSARSTRSRTGPSPSSTSSRPPRWPSLPSRTRRWCGWPRKRARSSRTPARRWARGRG